MSRRRDKHDKTKDAARAENAFTPRSSLGVRVSLYYAWMMLVMAIPQMLLFIIIYAGIAALELSGSVSYALSGARRLELSDEPGIYTAVLDGEGQALASNMPGTVGGDFFTRDETTGRDYVNIIRGIALDEKEETAKARIAVDITRQEFLLYKLLAALAALDILWAISCVKLGRKASDRLFKPIYDIAKTAQNLTEKNLNERINVDGTKSELKDMAVVINDMLDRIEQAYNSQKVFVSDASHELRTPIAVIQGYAEMLDRWGKQEPEIRDEAIAAILSESKAMQDLVEKLLYLARHDKNTVQLNRDYFDASEIVDKLARETAIIAENRQILIGKLHSAIIPGDRVALKQALRIFVDNAIKYTSDGGKITLSCEPEGEMCRITVEDTGIGIPPEDLKKVFDRFYRTDSVRTSGLQGHGLGLSIARLIALSHNGKIEVKSKPGKGSQFHLLLPM